MIDRDDMLELTRRMTLSRTCFDRIAGAYSDEYGEVDVFHANPEQIEEGLMYKMFGKHML